MLRHIMVNGHAGFEPVGLLLFQYRTIAPNNDPIVHPRGAYASDVRMETIPTYQIILLISIHVVTQRVLYPG